MLFAGSTREGHAGSLLLLQQQQLLQGQGGGLLDTKVVPVGGLWEPTSVLEQRHSPSPSPPTSASTLSSPLGTATAGVAALAGPNAAKNVSPPPVAAGPWPGGDDSAAPGGKEEWQLTPLDMGLGAGEAWDPAALSDAAAAAAAAPGGMGPDHTFLRWFIGGGEDASAGMGCGVMDPPVLDLDHHAPSSMPFGGPNLAFAPAMEDTKPAPFTHAPASFLAHHHHPQPHAAFFNHPHPSSFDAPKRTHPMGCAPAAKLPPFPPAGAGGGFLPGAATLKPKAESATDEAATAAVDQLAEAAKLAEAGNAFGAREILARLNYRLPAAPAAGTPLLRSAFYFKEALRLALSPPTEGPTPSASSPYDVVLKLGAYKAFSEVSPVLQFAHLTTVQAVLDELGGTGCVHVLDLDIGMGEQWASLMQELAQRSRPGAASLKVTALVSPSSHTALELQLIHENLSCFAAELGVLFHFAAYNVDTLDPAELLAAVAGSGEAVAVHLPVGSAHVAAMPAVLRLAKRLGARVVVAVDRGCDRTELPFATHLFQAFQSCVALLESMDAAGGADADTTSRIERFLVQPGVEQRVAARYRAGVGDSKPPPPMPWRTVFASAGFVPVPASSFAESQAESLLKGKVALMGFRVEKRAGALGLYWQRGELVSVSAWRC